MPKRVLSIGNCGYDHGNISSLLHKHFGAEVDAAGSAAEALATLEKEKYDLVLVNRVFDADGDSGIKLIKKLKTDNKLQTIPVMLVSNYPDAQTEAEAAGAVAGFGKNQLGRPQLVEQLKPFLKN